MRSTHSFHPGLAEYYTQEDCVAFYSDRCRAAIFLWESPNRSPASAKHLQGSCYLHSPLPAASLWMLVWPVSYQRLFVIQSTFISAQSSISHKLWAVCFITSSSLCWYHQCAGVTMTPVLPLSSVEVLVLRDAGGWGTVCLKSLCTVMSSISPNFEPKQYLMIDLQTSC